MPVAFGMERLSIDPICVFTSTENYSETEAETSIVTFDQHWDGWGTMGTY